MFQPTQIFIRMPVHLEYEDKVIPIRMAQRTGGIFISNTTLLLLGLVVILGILFFPLAVQQQQKPVPQATIVQVETSPGGDDRYMRAPKPERDWIPYRSSIRTRGGPEAYQSIGVLKLEGGEILPLYGRRTTSRSDRYQYYTRTDTYNPVQLPIYYKRRDCQDDIGCNELFDGENVQVGATGKMGSVTLYRISGPTYYG
jgi:hypothetical protein